MKTTVELNFGTIFGVAFVVVGLIILAFVSLTAFQLATGVIEPMKVSEERIGYGNEIFFGIVLQIGMFGILVAVAYILLKFGLMLVLRKEKV